MTRGEANIEWVETHLRIPEGKDVGKPFILRPFQCEIFLGIYDNHVSTRCAIISMGRKNAKTTLSAAIVLLHLCGPESTENSQLYSTGLSRDQASVIYELAAKMVRASPTISAVVDYKDSAKELVCPERGTTYKALAAEAKTTHGKSPKLVIHDELGQVRGPRSALYEAMETADGAHEDPLSIIISTQAPTDGDLLSILIDDAKKDDDPATKLWLWTADETDHEGEKGWVFTDEAMRQANPALGDFLKLESVQRKATNAVRMPSSEAAYRNLHLNQRIDSSSPLFSRLAWLACDGAPDESVLKSGKIYAGLDLSARNDLTALAYMAQDVERVWHVWVEFFAPAMGLLERAQRDRAPYDVWERAGWVKTTPGASVDYHVPATRLLEICDDYDVEVVAFDRWRIDIFTKEIARIKGIETGADDMAARVLEAVPLVPHGQGFKDMAPAIDGLEAALSNKQILHGGNPVLTWCAANARATRDPSGNRKLDKSKDTGRIDGVQALAMAFGGAGKIVEGPAGPSVYENRGLLEISI